MTAFVEFRPSAQTAINFSVDNALSTHAARTDCCSVPTAEPDVVLNEFRDRNRHRSFQITLKQSFGGSSAQRWRTNRRKAVGGRHNALQKRQCKISEVRLRLPTPFQELKPWPSQPSCPLIGRIVRSQSPALDEERLVRDTAEAYAQEKLLPRVTSAYLDERFDREIMSEFGELGLLAQPSPLNMAEPDLVM
jgi:hypothetical protein